MPKIWRFCKRIALDDYDQYGENADYQLFSTFPHLHRAGHAGLPLRVGLNDSINIRLTLGGSKSQQPSCHMRNGVTAGNFWDVRAFVSVSDKLRTQRSMVADPMGAAW